MTVTSSISSLLNGSYIRTIQDALGGSGARLTMQEGDLKSLRITGTPTGEGLKVKAKQESSQTRIDTISLSPAAHASMDNATIALKVIQALTPATVATSLKTQAAPAPQPTSPVTSLVATDPTLTSDADLAASDPTQVIHDTIAAANEALSRISTTEGFRAEMNSDPASFQTFLKDYTYGNASAIQRAFDNNTLQVQSVDATGWNSEASSLNVSGVSESFGGGYVGQPRTTSDGRTYFGVDGGFGTLILSWPTK